MIALHLIIIVLFCLPIDHKASSFTLTIISFHPSTYLTRLIILYLSGNSKKHTYMYVDTHAHTQTPTQRFKRN